MPVERVVQLERPDANTNEVGWTDDTMQVKMEDGTMKAVKDLVVGDVFFHPVLGLSKIESV